MDLMEQQTEFACKKRAISMHLESADGLLITQRWNNEFQILIKQSTCYEMQMTNKSIYLQIKWYILVFLEPHNCQVMNKLEYIS